MSVRVFLSHSSDELATDGPLRFARELRQSLHKSLAAAGGYEPLIDLKDIGLGESWRQVINGWIADCDAAVPILSAKAMKSAWVQYEMSVLSFRISRKDGLRLYPVFLDDPKTWDTDKPTGITEHEGLKVLWDAAYDDPVQRAAKILEITNAVLAALANHQPLANRPVDRAAHRVEVRLAALSEAFLAQEAQHLQVANGGWTPRPQLARQVAIQLLTLGLNAPPCDDSLNRLSGEIDNREHFHDVIGVLASSWVHEAAIDVLEQAIHGQRAVACSAREEEIASFYLWRRGQAKDFQPCVGWQAFLVKWSSGQGGLDEQIEDLVERIWCKLADELHVSADKLEARLNTRAKKDLRVFIALSCRGVTPEVLERLRAVKKLASVGFFFLDREPGRPELDELVRKGNVLLLTPRIAAEEEQRYVTAYRESRETWID